MAIKKKKKAVKRAVAKRRTAKKATPKKVAAPKPVGRVTHFYTEIKVAVVKFSKPVKKGTEVQFKGATTDFSQKLDSMQYDHKAVATAPKGKQVGVKVKKRVREGDQVYL
jgi:putative protease